MKKLILIKLGGSVITDKNQEQTVRTDNLRHLVGEIARAQVEIKQKLIVGHGQGSFAHVPAHKYKTIEGFINGQSRLGMAITQDCAAQLNRIVVEQFITQNLPAVSYLFSNSLVTDNGKAAEWNSKVLEEYLDKDILPITGGDVIVDQSQGCAVWSTEKVLAYIATNLPMEFRVERIIHVTETDGVLDKDGHTIASITPASAAEVKKHIAATKGTDVTGGMWHKITESLQLAEQGIESYIISGNIEDNLYQALLGGTWQGTKIHQ